jgi:hypothetical protein
MHGDPPERIAAKIADLRARRERWGGPPLKFGVAGYVVCRDTDAEAQRELERITTLRPGAPGFENFGQWVNGTQLEQRLKLEDYSVSNRGLRSGLVGTAESIADRLAEFEPRAWSCCCSSSAPRPRRWSGSRQGDPRVASRTVHLGRDRRGGSNRRPPDGAGGPQHQRLVSEGTRSRSGSWQTFPGSGW